MNNNNEFKIGDYVKMTNTSGMFKTKHAVITNIDKNNIIRYRYINENKEPCASTFSISVEDNLLEKFLIKINNCPEYLKNSQQK